MSIAFLAGCSSPDPNPSERVEREIARYSPKTRLSRDTTRCPGAGDGYIYASLGEFVFRVPSSDQPLVRSPLHNGIPVALTPPAPQAPEGCREHPAAAQMWDLHSLQDRILGDGWAGHELVAITLSADRDNAAYLQRADEALFEHVRTRNPCVLLGASLLACDAPAGTVYAVVPASNSEGQPSQAASLVVVCGIGRVLKDECSVSHSVQDRVALTYRFYRGAIAEHAFVPVERIVELDQAIRDGIGRMTVAEYPWGSQAPIGGVPAPGR